MPSVLRSTQHDLYTAALARAHAQLWRAARLADSLDRPADVLILADSAAAVHRAHERQIGCGALTLRTQGPTGAAARAQELAREALKRQERTGRQPRRSRRDGGAPRGRAESA